MKVYDLIEKLKRCNPDAEVLAYSLAEDMSLSDNPPPVDDLTAPAIVGGLSVVGITSMTNLVNMEQLLKLDYGRKQYFARM